MQKNIDIQSIIRLIPNKRISCFRGRFPHAVVMLTALQNKVNEKQVISKEDN